MDHRRRQRILEKVAQNQFGQPGGYSAEAAYAKGSPIASALSSAGSEAKNYVKYLATRGYEDRKRDQEMVANLMGPDGPLAFLRKTPPKAPARPGYQSATAKSSGE